MGQENRVDIGGKGRLGRWAAKAQALWEYVSAGVWRDTRDTWKVRAVKIANISVRGFLNSDLQSQACAMTFRMLLAIVPVLALVFAIGRGFGFQNLLESELLHYLPSQKTALQATFKFVDSYLNQASEGVFVGVGIVFLLWTLISLLMSVEDSFNSIWHVRSGRSIWRKITDYTAILLVLPVLMICSAGLSLLMSSTLQSVIDVEFLRPAINWLLDLGSLLFTAMFFAGAYMLIPNTRVKPVYALVIGFFVAVAFQMLQWVFVTGQMYVTRYNAIYGSFSFLPLMLIWLQLVWLITLIGALLCYACQNAGAFNYYIDVDNISVDYRRKVALAVMAVIAKRFELARPPLTAATLAVETALPESLVNTIVMRLHNAGLVAFLDHPGDFGEHPLQPAFDVRAMTAGEVVRRLQMLGSSDFIPGFEEHFAAVDAFVSSLTDEMIEKASATPITSLVKDYTTNP